jgi:hypothetical protein
MAAQHPEVWRWREEPCDRVQEIHATTCHTGCRQSRGDGLSHPLQQRSVGLLSSGAFRVRLIAQGAARSTFAR